VAFPGAVEPARLEWFLAGTEPPTAAPAIAGGHPRIIAPVSGTIIALDPDIPEGRERLVFEATDAREPLRWVLDGDDLGPAHELHVWRPVRGRHGLALVDGHGRVVDRVSFDVRGVPRAAHVESYDTITDLPTGIDQGIYNPTKIKRASNVPSAQDSAGEQSPFQDPRQAINLGRFAFPRIPRGRVEEVASLPELAELGLCLGVSG
jgi:hypothetical protein